MCEVASKFSFISIVSLLIALSVSNTQAQTINVANISDARINLEVPVGMEGEDFSSLNLNPYLELENIMLEEQKPEEVLDFDFSSSPELFNFIGGSPFRFNDFDDTQIELLERDYAGNERKLQWLREVATNRSPQCRVLVKKVQGMATETCEEGKCLDTENIDSRLQEAMQKYDDSCAGSLEGLDAQLDSTVAIYFKESLRCLGWANEHEIITARHCFLHGDMILPHIEAVDNAWETIRFQYASLSNLSRRTTVQARLPARDPRESDDVIVFPFSDTSNREITLAQTAKDALLLTANQYLSQPDLNAVEVRRYNKPSCGIIAQNRDCLIHTCPTLISFSGAPIYQETNSGYRLIGIHSGHNASATPSCHSLRYYHGGNTAIQLSSTTRFYKALDTIKLQGEAY